MSNDKTLFKVEKRKERKDEKIEPHKPKPVKEKVAKVKKQFCLNSELLYPKEGMMYVVDSAHFLNQEEKGSNLGPRHTTSY